MGFVFGPCFVVQYVVSLSSCWGGENWLLLLNCLSDVMWLLWFCASSSWCRGLVCVIVAFSCHTHFLNSDYQSRVK